MRVLVCGGRDYSDVDMVSVTLKGLKFTWLIQGGADGADRLARDYAEAMGIPIKTYLADWEKHGKAAGPIRNQRMLDEGRPDLVVAFPGGRGTADMVRQASRRGVPVLRVMGP